MTKDLEGQLGLFASRLPKEQELPRVRKVRRVKAPERVLGIELRPLPPRHDFPCVNCGSEFTELVSVTGKVRPPELHVAHRCRDCREDWIEKRPRKDVCAHGVHLAIPCAECPRTWEDVDLRAGE